MSLTPAEIANAPTFTLAGKAFHIPRLAIKQNRVVVSGLQKLLPVISKLEDVARSVAAGGSGAETFLSSFPLNGDTFDTLADIVYAAITRGDPTFGRDQFDDLPIGVDELLMALPVVMAQSFAFTKKPEGTPAAPAGEAMPPSIGTASSSESAERSDGPGTTSKAA